MKKFRNETEFRNAIEKSFPVPEKLSPENIEANLKGERGYSITGGITSTKPKSRKKSDGKVYAKGPGLWGLGVAMAAIAVVVGVSFFKGGNLGILPFGAGASLDDKELVLTIDGYDREGKYLSEISVEKCRDDLTAKLELDPQDSMNSARFYLFINGVTVDDDSANNLLNSDEYHPAGLSWFEDVKEGEFVQTDDGFYGECSFSLYDESQLSGHDLESFSITAVAVIEKTDGSYSYITDTIYNNAYDDKYSIDNLKKLYNHDTVFNIERSYDTALIASGYAFGMYAADTNNNVTDATTLRFVENWSDEDILNQSLIGLQLYAKPLSDDPQYAFENSYYLYEFIDGRYVPVIDKSYTGEDYHIPPMLSFTDADGEPRCFFITIERSIIGNQIDAIAIPATYHNTAEPMFANAKIS